jgi:hypothetical protein
VAERPKMDFQRLFKRKQEGPVSPFTNDDGGDALRDRNVTLREGELLDGNSPAPLEWSKVGGAITVKAGQILGVLEGRTRIKASVLEELHPGKFAKLFNPETEFNIPLHVVIVQIKDIFSGTPLTDASFENLETPFAELAREDEARFKESPGDQLPIQPVVDPKSLHDFESARTSWPALLNLNETGDIAIRLGEQTAPVYGATSKEIASKQSGADNDPVLHVADPPHSGVPPALRRGQSHSPRREGHDRLQELYLTDEPLDGAKISDLVLQLPRVTGVVIMQLDGVVLGGELGRGISESLLSLAPDFARHVSRFTEILPGGPARFITFFAYALQINLVTSGDVLMLVWHEGKNLPPGLRERLIATAEALSAMYSSRL